MKYRILAALAVISVLAFLLPCPVQAGSGLVVNPGLVLVNFPASISISISAQSDVNITDVRVHYAIERKSFAQVVAEVNIAIVPAKEINTQWFWDMRMSGGLPPGSDVTYWVSVTDSSGNRVETLPNVVHFDDNRYDWKTIHEGQVTLYWYKGDDAFGEELMAAAQTALTRMSDNTGAELENAVSIYIYGSSDELVGALINAREWTGGIAFTEYDTVAIGINPDTELEWGKRTIAHELTHLVTYQVTANPYNNMPTWLSEGLSMFAEGPLNLNFVLALSMAESEDSFISVRSLCSPFSANYDQALLSYAQSYKIVSYLINEYGRDKIREMLGLYKQGIGYDEALVTVYGFDMEELNSLWRTEPVAVYGN